jgi:1-acyl-sn-glycerol-3-phosphate acyltransferase
MMERSVTAGRREERAMEGLPYDVTEDIDAAQTEPLPEFWKRPGVLVRGVRSLVAVALRSWLHVYDRLTIVGRHNLPADRSFILVANHSSHLDTLCLLSALPIRRRHYVFPIAARDYFCANPPRAFIARTVVNVMPIDRHAAPHHGLRACAGLLKQPDTVLVLFPEGTRSGGCEPGEFKPGVGLLAAGQDIPVVPCHLAGTHAALPKGAWCPRPRAVRLAIGAPRLYAHLPATRKSRRHICCDLREAVMSLGRENRLQALS